MDGTDHGKRGSAMDELFDLTAPDGFWQYAVGMRGVRVERIQRADDLRVDDLVSRALLLQFAGEYYRRVIRQKRRPRNVPVIGRDHHFRPEMRNVVTARNLRRILHRQKRGVLAMIEHGRAFEDEIAEKYRSKEKTSTLQPLMRN